MSASSTILKELRSQLMSRLNVSIKAEIAKELVPILMELHSMMPESDTHLVSMQLFKWLVHLHRTADEFSYVIGSLGQHVFDITEDETGHSGYFGILGNVAAEALAFQCPIIIEGSWELAALLVLELRKKVNSGEYGIASDHLSRWIICAIGDPDLCPNPDLRIEVMYLLSGMVKINDQNRDMAFKSVMFACKSLNHSNMHLVPSVIPRTLEMFTEYNYLYEIDQIISGKLKDIKRMRQSAILHDVSYEIRINPNRYTEPMELHSLAALLKSTAGYAKQLNSKGVYIVGNNFSELTQLLETIVYSFRSSCQMPQVIELTASCVMEIVEVVLQLTVSFADSEITLCCVREVEDTLGWFLDENKTDTITTSPVGKEIIRKYYKRLNSLGAYLNTLGSIQLNEFPTIHNLVYFG